LELNMVCKYVAATYILNNKQYIYILNPDSEPSAVSGNGEHGARGGGGGGLQVCIVYWN